MRSYKTEGIIIKRRNFGEGDRILTVLTKTYGKIQVKAPGVRKITSRRSSHIELLNIAFLSLYRNSYSFFPIVTEAEAQEEFLSIKKSLKKIGFAYYICELIDSLCAQNQENRRVFFLVKETLFKLANSKNDYAQEFRSRHSGESAQRTTPESPSFKIMRDSGRAHSSLARMTEGGESLSIIGNFEDELLVTLGFLPRQHKLLDKRTFIESILEKKLKTRRLLPLFLSNNER